MRVWDTERTAAPPAARTGSHRSVTVIGGGLDELVAAIRCAEQGAPVVLHEARRQLGGRARSTEPPYIANQGPHGLSTDGITSRFLLDRRIAMPVTWPPVGGTWFHHEGNFRSWERRRWEDKAAALLCGAGGIFTYHHDPAELSAAFVAERFSSECSRCHRRSGTYAAAGPRWWRHSNGTPGHSAYGSRRRAGWTGCPTHL